MNIGIVGYSSHHIDQEIARTLLQQAIQELIQVHARSATPADICIISGLTNIGIPKVAYQIADQQGYRTVGISAQRALTVKCAVYAVDEQIIVGLDFGDESDQFITAIDYLVRIGGGKQSRNEVELFKNKCLSLGREISQHLIERELEYLRP